MLVFDTLQRSTPNHIVFPVKTGRWGGVVTAFITMSPIKDEIDWEWPGAKTTEAQSNFFWQGLIRMYPPAPRQNWIAHLFL